MDKLLKKQIAYLITLTIVGLVLLAGIFFFLRAMKSKMSKVVEIKEQIASYEKNKKVFSEESEKIKSLEFRLKNVESNIVTTETLPELLSSIESLADQNNIDFEITSVQTPVVDDKSQLFIEFGSEGSYPNIQSFLNQIQHQAFQIKFSKLFLFSEQSENSNQITSGTLSIKKTNKTTSSSGKKWQAIGTIEILSF